MIFASKKITTCDVDSELDFLMEDIWIAREGSVVINEWVEVVKERVAEFLAKRS